jgi:hypothetical protein
MPSHFHSTIHWSTGPSVSGASLSWCARKKGYGWPASAAPSRPEPISAEKLAALGIAAMPV